MYARFAFVFQYGHVVFFGFTGGLEQRFACSAAWVGYPGDLRGFPSLNCSDLLIEVPNLTGFRSFRGWSDLPMLGLGGRQRR